MLVGTAVVEVGVDAAELARGLAAIGPIIVGASPCQGSRNQPLVCLENSRSRYFENGPSLCSEATIPSEKVHSWTTGT